MEFQWYVGFLLNHFSSSKNSSLIIAITHLYRTAGQKLSYSFQSSWSLAIFVSSRSRVLIMKKNMDISLNLISFF